VSIGKVSHTHTHNTHTHTHTHIHKHIHYTKGSSRDSSVHIVIRLRAESPRKCGSILGRSKRLSLPPKAQTDSGVHTIFYSVGNRGYFPECIATEA
jgi:ABC-type Zn2+ transport system substrate-binding protein/surface adhesin